MTIVTRERKLTAKQESFVLAYLETGNATEAYRRSYNVANMRPMTIAGCSQELLRNPLIANALEKLRAQAVEKAVISRAQVLDLITDLATADATQLTQVQHRCCRHCWGRGFKYQWKSADEFAYEQARVMHANAKALAAWEKKPKKADPPEEAPMPTDEGGYGFEVFREPNPECFHCQGEGHEIVKFADTRKLTGAAKRLFAGVKRTKEGMEIKMRDQDAALRMLAQHHNIAKEVAIGVAVQNNTNVINGEVPNDPVAAARVYQDILKD